jgi:hypothetical protein
MDAIERKVNQFLSSERGRACLTSSYLTQYLRSMVFSVYLVSQVSSLSSLTRHNSVSSLQDPDDSAK